MHGKSELKIFIILLAICFFSAFQKIIWSLKYINIKSSVFILEKPSWEHYCNK